MDTVESADGTAIAYERSGSGPPLVLVHGSGATDHRRWEIGGVRPALAEHSTVYAIDRRGRGESGDATEYAFEREVADVLAVLDVIDEPVTLLGHSFGANIALKVSVRTDDLAALILYEPAIPTGDHEFSNQAAVDEINSFIDDGMNEQAVVVFEREIGGLTSAEIEVFRSDPSWEDRVAAAHTLPREEAAIATFSFDPDRFATMTAPTVLMTGGDSPPLYSDATKAVANALPNSRIVTFEGEKHVAMNNRPDRFVDEVLAATAR